jgi:hypothetical protein
MATSCSTYQRGSLASARAALPFLEADLAEPGQTFLILTGAGTVVYLGAILILGLRPEGETFRNNTLSPYTVQRGHLAGYPAGRVGVDGDHARAPFRPGSIGLRTHWRGARALPGVELRAL